MFETVGLIVGAIVVLVFLIMFNQRRKPALENAYRILEPISQAGGGELERISEVLELARESIGDNDSFRQRNLKGESLELGEQILRQVDGLESMSAELQRVLAECDALMHPSSPVAQAANMLTTSRYLHCVNLIQGKSFQTFPFPGDEKSTDSNWVVFDQFLKTMQRRRRLTSENLQRFLNDLSCATNSVSSLQDQLESITAVQEKLAQMRDGASEKQVRRSYQDRNWLDVPLLYDKLLPSLEDQAQNLVDEVQRDPVGVQETALPKLAQKLNDIASVISAIEKANVKDIEKIESSRIALREAGLSTRWIDRRQRELEDELERFVSKSVDQDNVSELAEGITRGLSQFSVKITQCIALAQKLNEEFEPELDQLEADLAEARKTIAERLDVSDILTLRESGYSPDDELQRARQQFLAVKAALGRGDIDSANSAIGEIEVETSEAARFIEDSLQAMEEFPGKIQLRQGTLESLTQRLPRMKSALDQATDQLDRSSLVVEVNRDNPALFDVRSIPGSDEGSSQQNGSPERIAKSLYDLSRAAENWIRSAEDGIRNAQRSFERGHVLVACNEIDLFEAELEDLESFIDRLEARISFLNQLQEENRTELAQAQQRFAALQSEIESKTTEASNFAQSRQACDDLTQQIQQWRFDSGSPHPIKDRQNIESFKVALDDLRGMIHSEDQAYHETLDALSGAEQEMRIARQLVKNSIQDGVPDSQQITRDQAEVQKLEQRLEALQLAVKSQTGEWIQLDREATQIQVELSQVNGRLRNEVKAARHAAQAIQTAAEAVFQAANYRGPFGIVVVGRPGSDELNRARVAISKGQYHQATLLASEAERSANNGLVAAQSQASRQQRNARQNMLRRERMKREYWN